MNALLNPRKYIQNTDVRPNPNKYHKKEQNDQALIITGENTYDRGVYKTEGFTFRFYLLQKFINRNASLRLIVLVKEVSPEAFADLFDICLTMTHLNWDGEIYK